jgi:hypothetical protein
MTRLRRWHDEHLCNHYFSGKTVTRFRVYFLPTIAVAIALGPFYFLLLGAIEWAIFYPVAFYLLKDSLSLGSFAICHLALSLVAPFLLSISLNIRAYKRTTRAEVRGRFPLIRTFW